MSENYTDPYKKEELIADCTVERKIEYKDVDYYVPKEDVRDVRRRLEILRNFSDGNVRVRYWNKLQNVGKDTPACFIEMLRYLRTHDFDFHRPAGEVEWSWVFEKLQTSSRHRLEMLPGNIDLGALVVDLNELRVDAAVVVNLGGGGHLLNSALYSLRRLVWLNMSDSNVGNGKVQSVVQAINRGTLPNLRAMVLTGNPGVEVGKLAEDLRRLTGGKLRYVEGDWEQVPQDDGDSDGPVLVPLSLGGEFRLLTDAGKLEHLVRRGLVEPLGVHPPPPGGPVLLEYCVCPAFSWAGLVAAGTRAAGRGRSFGVRVDAAAARRAVRAEGERVAGAGTRTKTGGRPVVRRRGTRAGKR